MATPITPIQTHRVTDHLLTSKDESIFTIKIDHSPSDSISSSAADVPSPATSVPCPSCGRGESPPTPPVQLRELMEILAYLHASCNPMLMAVMIDIAAISFGVPLVGERVPNYWPRFSSKYYSYIFSTLIRLFVS